MRRFWTGFAVCWTIDKLAWTLAVSNTNTGALIMGGVLGRLSHDRFLNVKAAVDAENDRRSDSF